MARNNRAVELLAGLRRPEIGNGRGPMIPCLTQTMKGMRGRMSNTLILTRMSFQRARASKGNSSRQRQLMQRLS
ncbi:Hypothetical predicted protein [Pelobates cultripes]|uniref:Uncharacterized protein n=1 Tax=Pelobates cultripes TaxID=61616 RepID=A0AAD1WKB5_PELCU|nr:Hypothetical predicted protein [Pelobates cultripes]